MTDEITVYEKPTCTKCREMNRFLVDNGIDFSKVNYYIEPLTKAKLKELLAAHPGTTPVQVRFVSTQGMRPLEVGTFKVEPGAGLLSELRMLLGTEAATIEPRGQAPIASIPEAVATPSDS